MAAAPRRARQSCAPGRPPGSPACSARRPRRQRARRLPRVSGPGHFLTHRCRKDTYIGQDNGPGARSGLKCFEEIDEIALVAAPGQTSPAVQDALLSHCERRRDRFAILDSPETVQGGVGKLPLPRSSKFGAYYFPWIQMHDQVRGHVCVPPSGHVAGVYARVDEERGVHRSHVNKVVRGAVGVKYTVSKDDRDLLQQRGINCLKTRTGAEVRIWSEHTLSSDPSWRYITVRRLAIMVETSIERALQWMALHTNRPLIFSQVTRAVSEFLTVLWRSGALQGETLQGAFYVKCDEENNPPEDTGSLVVEIGLALAKSIEHEAMGFLIEIRK